MRQIPWLMTMVLVVGVTRDVAMAQADQTTTPNAAPAAVDETSLRTESRIALKKLEFAIKDLTPQQRAKALPIIAEYGPLHEAMAKKKQDEHEASLAEARRTSTPIDLKAADIRSALRNRQQYQLEAKYFDRIRDEVLTPEQKVKWDGYRLHLVAGFQLGMMGLTQEQNKELGAMCEQVARDIPALPDESGYDLFQRRLSALKTRAAAKYFNDEQKKKLADSRNRLLELNKQMDELEAREKASGEVK